MLDCKYMCFVLFSILYTLSFGFCYINFPFTALLVKEVFLFVFSSCFCLFVSSLGTFISNNFTVIVLNMCILSVWEMHLECSLSRPFCNPPTKQNFHWCKYSSSYFFLASSLLKRVCLCTYVLLLIEPPCNAPEPELFFTCLIYCYL